jgi:hypothetical protein
VLPLPSPNGPQLQVWLSMEVVVALDPLEVQSPPQPLYPLEVEHRPPPPPPPMLSPPPSNHLHAPPTTRGPPPSQAPESPPSTDWWCQYYPMKWLLCQVLCQVASPTTLDCSRHIPSHQGAGYLTCMNIESYS